MTLPLPRVAAGATGEPHLPRPKGPCLEPTPTRSCMSPSPGTRPWRGAKPVPEQAVMHAHPRGLSAPLHPRGRRRRPGRVRPLLAEAQGSWRSSRRECPRSGHDASPGCGGCWETQGVPRLMTSAARHPRRRTGGRGSLGLGVWAAGQTGPRCRCALRTVRIFAS